MKRRKRKIRIPAAQYGLNGSTLTTPEQQNMNYMQSLLNNSYQTPMQQYINSNGVISKQIEDFQAQANINNQVNANRLATISPLNTPINGIGGAASSANNIAGGVSAAGDLITGGIDAVQNSQHETKGQSAASALGSAAKMGAAGAAPGSVIPGVGTAIGAVVGAIAGVVTSGLTKGEKAKMTSFTDYDPGKQAGFLRPGRRAAIEASREHVKKNAYDNRSAVRGTANLLADYNLKYGDMNTNTFAYGGMPSSLAYVDDGELINTPDGGITAVPEEGKPTDSNLVDLPVGSRILSDKLKVPGSKETFAEAGKKIMKRKKSLSNDIYAQNAAKLNEINEQQAFDQLYDLQESVKAKRKIKSKSKAIPAYENGKEDGDNYWSRLWKRLKKLINSYDGIDPNVILKATGNNNQLVLEKNIGAPAVDLIMEPIVDPVTSLEPVNITTTTTKPAVKASKPVTKSEPTIPTPPVVEQVWDVDLPELTMAGLSDIKGKGVNAPTPSKVKAQPIKTKPVKNQNSRSINVPDLEQIGSGIASLVPIISNLNAKPEYQDPNYNPYADAVLNTMRNRRYNINPALRDIQRNRAIANYDASQMNTNTGANLAFRLQNAVNTNRAIADARAYESNVNNQYLSDYANMLNSLGQQWANETTRVDDANMANRAAARNIRRAGLSGLSQWAQSRELMRNQRERDNAMLELYRDFLSQGFTDSTISNWGRYIRRGGNR